METMPVARIYYVGDWALMLGPVFVESPFAYEHKGTEVFNYGRWLSFNGECGKGRRFRRDRRHSLR